MVRGTSALLILGLAALALAELLIAPALPAGTSASALRGAAALGALGVATAVLGASAMARSRFTVVLLGLSMMLFAAMFDTIHARAAASLPEALAWAAVGMIFARVFDTPGAAIAVPLLVAGLTLGGLGADHSTLKALADAGDPLTLELPAFGGGQALALPAIDVTLLGAMCVWGATLNVRLPWTAVLVVEAMALGAALGIDPLPLTVAAFLLPNADRAVEALQAAGS